ncbi:MAG: flavodoxin family protein [Planctomycetota bacterium]
MTDVLAIAASARRGGNSDAVLETALDVMRERGANVETIYPRKLSITPCRSCNGCWETGRCVVKDEMQELYIRFCEVDHIVVASPLYFTSLPGHFKVLIDRFQCFWVQTFRLGEPPEPRRTGMFLCVSALRRKRYFDYTLTIVKSWMASLNMACPVARLYPGVDERTDLVTNHPEYLDDARAAALELLEGGS